MKELAIGIDVGGTKIAAGLVDRKGNIRARFVTQVHTEKEPPAVISCILDAYYELLHDGGVKEADLQGLCVGFGGTVNGHTGTVFISSNLPAWDHFPLRDHLQEHVGTPVTVENDTNLCALGEHRFGAGAGSRNMCYVTLSTGLGLGIIINNELSMGHTGTAGEIGHAVVHVNGGQCTCGKKGCLMAYTSAVGISRMAYEQIKLGKPTILRDSMPPGGARFRGEDVREAAQRGDEVAREILEKAGYYLGVAMSWIVQIINPELIVVGGGLMRMGPLILNAAQKGLRENTQPQLVDLVKIVPWTLGDDLGIVGASVKVFSEVGGSHFSS
jgi:glucokinase